MPLVNRTFDQLIDFTRTSAATFVNSSGNIASTPQSRNLLTFTQEFDNAAWTATRASVTANSTTAPDGTSTADTLVEDSTASNSHRIQRIVNIPGSAITFSLYMKASGRNWAYLRIDDASTTRFAYFNLATGVVGTVNAGLTATITSVGNGWYRCVTTLAAPAATATGNVVFGSATADNSDSYTGTGIASIFIWGAQLEQASAVTDYTRNFGGLFPPRFDYDPVTRAPRGLLIEEQRTNLLTYSEQFDNAAWNKGTGGSISANSVTSPDGTSNADAYTWGSSTTSFAFLSQIVSTASNVANTFSIWLKRPSGSGSRTVRLTISDVATSTGNSSTFTVTESWQRFEFTRTSASSTGQVGVGFNVGSTGTPIAAGEVLEVWGAQLEAGAFATSYIPTVASQVTRSADNATINAPNFASWYNQSEGTLVVEASTAQASSNRIVEMSGGTSSRVVDLLVITSSGSQVQMYNGTATVTPSNALTLNQPFKTAAAYKTASYGIVLNGGTVAAATDALVNTANALQIGRFNAATNYLNGHIRSIRYYPARLSNSQLQALTA